MFFNSVIFFSISLDVCEFLFFVFFSASRLEKFRRIDWFSCISNDAVEIIFGFYRPNSIQTMCMCVFFFLARSRSWNQLSMVFDYVRALGIQIIFFFCSEFVFAFVVWGQSISLFICFFRVKNRCFSRLFVFRWFCTENVFSINSTQSIINRQNEQKKIIFKIIGNFFFFIRYNHYSCTWSIEWIHDGDS